MKRFLILVVILFVALISFGCKSKDELDINHGKEDEEEIAYKVDQILLSKSFQVTNPSVEIISKNNSTRILASLGLTESSGVKVNKLVKRANEIDIHVSSIYEDGSLQVAVPQVILEIEQDKLDNMKDLEFNIVNDDYRPLKIKVGVNEVLSKIESHFKISSNGIPTIDLTRLDDNMLWNISYDSIFDRDNSKTPLVNLFATVDATTGDIVESKKTFISSSIDDGHILDYVANNYILYKKSVPDTEIDKIEEQLWFYDILNKEKSMIFSSNFKINSGKFSTDLSYVSVIEGSDNGAGLYIIPRENKKAYKISFEDKFNPKVMGWKDDNNLYLINNVDGKSTIVSHNVEENITSKVARVNKNIESLTIMDKMFLIVEGSEDSHNKKISITFDWKNFNLIDDGFNPKFIGEDKLAYLVKDEKLDTNSLVLYSIKNNKNIDIIDENISTFQVLSDESLVYVKKNPNYNNFTLAEYSLASQDIVNIASLVSDRAYYDTDREVVYANITLPFENDSSEIIYLINLSKLN